MKSKRNSVLKDNRKKIGSIISIIITSSILIAFGLLVSANSTADNFGVENASGYKDTNVLVPVNITNVHSESIVGIEFKILYDDSVINLAEIRKGSLTAEWGDPFKAGSEGDYIIGIVGVLSKAITNSSTGSVVVLNFSIIGNPDEVSRMNFTNIKLVNTSWDETGTALAKNGTFTIISSLSEINKTVLFSDTSLGGDDAEIVNWIWSFYYENCTLIESISNKDVNYTFPSYGKYYVELEVENECGNKNNTGLVCVYTGCPLPKAKFEHTAYSC